MKICLLSRFFDLRNAGIGRYSQELLRELKKKNDFEIQTVSQDGGIPLGQGMIKYFAYSSFEVRFKIPKADVYHALTPIESMHAPSPLVVTFHDLIPLLHLHKIKTHYAGNKFGRWFVKRYFRKACRAAVKADKITTVSEQTRQELKEHFGIDAEVVRHGIDPNLEPDKKKDNVIRVGTLGFLGPRKRHDLLIESFLDANMDEKLVIGGSFSLKNKEHRRLKKLAHNDSRIKFPGFIKDEKLRDFYNSLDAFILTSKFEGYGLPAVEAMACKTPVVTLSDAVIPSDVKNRTIVVDDLQSWLENPDFSSVNLNEAYKFAKSHNWGKTAERFSEIYEEVVK